MRAAHGCGTIRRVSDVLLDLERQRLSIGAWSRRVTRVTHDGHDRWSVTLGLRNGATFRLEWSTDEPIYVSLWSGEPEDSPGSAVIVSRHGMDGIKRIPVCGCGEQGCADASFQFRGWFDADDIPALVEVIESLAPTKAKLGDANFWRPDVWDRFTPRSEWPDLAGSR
jgi:hypothetical protein